LVAVDKFVNIETIEQTSNWLRREAAKTAIDYKSRRSAKKKEKLKELLGRVRSLKRELENLLAR
jgi:hypothetical protein